MKKAVVAAAALLLLARGVEAASVRSEVPVRQMVMAGGDKRFALKLKVGDTEIEAGLDTGSTGLRVLPNTLKETDAKGTGEPDSISFGGGAMLLGEMGNATVTIGGASGTIPLELVKDKQCLPRLPNCAAGKVSMREYGILGDGRPGQGFAAIIGINMNPNKVRNPLLALGVTSWILELPRTPSESGRLILNPGDEEVKAFTTVPLLLGRANLHDSVQGCITDPKLKANGCGPITLDTGAGNIGIGGLEERNWNGDTAAITFYDGQTPRAAESFTAGEPGQSAKLNFVRSLQDEPGILIHAGVSPYLAFCVLYDSRRRLMGFKARPPASGAPTGAVYPN